MDDDGCSTLAWTDVEKQVAWPSRHIGKWTKVSNHTTWVPASTLEHTLHVKTSSCALISHMSCGQHRNAWIKFCLKIQKLWWLQSIFSFLPIIQLELLHSGPQVVQSNGNLKTTGPVSELRAKSERWFVGRHVCFGYKRNKEIKQRTSTKRKICLQSWKLQSSSKQFCWCFGGPVCSWCTVSTPLFLWRSASRAPNNHETGWNCDRKPAQHSWTAYGCNSALVLIDMRKSTWPFLSPFASRPSWTHSGVQLVQHVTRQLGQGPTSWKFKNPEDSEDSEAKGWESWRSWSKEPFFADFQGSKELQVPDLHPSVARIRKRIKNTTMQDHLKQLTGLVRCPQAHCHGPPPIW